MSTRERIVKTAHRLLHESVVNSISMRKVADRIGVSATAIYRHYRNKEALLDAVTEESFEIFADYLATGRAKTPPIAGLRALCQRLLDFALDHPDRYDFLFVIP